jgi:dTDP-4-amino-4,6-dideoxygalactose transaminase
MKKSKPSPPAFPAGRWAWAAKAREFEARFTERLGRPFLMVDSGSNALYLAMTLLGLPPGSQVIVPSLTWVSCAQAVVLAGHKPVFADVDLDAQNLDAVHVERVLTRETKAIMAVHYAGKPVRVEILRPFGLPILEDAAHAVDSTLNGKYCGALCDVGIYSFDSVKNLATPEGGGLTAADPKRIERVKHLRYCGIGKPQRKSRSDMSLFAMIKYTEEARANTRCAATHIDQTTLAPAAGTARCRHDPAPRSPCSCAFQAAPRTAP